MALIMVFIISSSLERVTEKKSFLTIAIAQNFTILYFRFLFSPSSRPDVPYLYKIYNYFMTFKVHNRRET